MSAQAVSHGAFYVRHYTVARRIVFYYGDPDAAGGASVRCGAFDCAATNADELDTWLAGPEGLAAVRESWKVVADFAREALALYEQFQNPPGQEALLRTPDPAAGATAPERDVRADPQPGDRVVDPRYPVWVEVRFATADRVYVNVSSIVDPDTDFDAPLRCGPDGVYFSRKIWGSVVDYVRA